MYLMLNTRPDLSTAVNFYSCFQNDAKLIHWKGLNGFFDTLEVLLIMAYFSTQIWKYHFKYMLMQTGLRMMIENQQRDFYFKFLVYCKLVNKEINWNNSVVYRSRIRCVGNSINRSNLVEKTFSRL